MSQQKLKSFTARMYSTWTISGFRFNAFKCCQAENAVHIGVPMIISGSSAWISAHARRRISSSSKCHTLPSVSLTVRSKANPVNTSYCGHLGKRAYPSRRVEFAHHMLTRLVLFSAECAFLACTYA